MKTLEEYLDRYGHMYSEYALDTIINNFYTDSPADIIVQIKSKLGLIDKEHDVYEGFIEHLKEHELLHGRILEVGCGFYPTMAEKIRDYDFDVNLTCVDPRLVTTDLPGLKLIKGTFPEDTRGLNKYDAIISLLPCEATIPIIEESRVYSKPYSIALCMCTHFDDPFIHYPVTYDNWERYVRKQSHKETNAKIEEGYFKEQYNVPFLLLTKKY